MKSYYKLFAASAICAATLAITACNDYDYDSELARAEIIGPFSLQSATDVNTYYTSSIEGDVITIKINPFADVESELNGALPLFYLPMGATCSPSPVEPQNFNEEVKYTVTSGDGKNSKVYTVKWGPSDPLPVGGGYAFSRIQAEKLYTELGYPGTPMVGDDGGDAPHGDIIFFPAFSGDKIVGFSRVYAWGNSQKGFPANPALAFKVWDANTLEPVNATLNLGSLNAGEIVNITNDWVGNIVCATGGVNGAPSAAYYWTSLDAAPVKIGDLPQPVYFNTHNVDAAMFIQVAGDITKQAVISYMGQRGATGEHVAVNVVNGQVQNSKTITTGYPSNDRSWFQMISFFGTDNASNYLVGETEGDGNGSVRVYYNTSSGMTASVMPAYLNGKPFSDGVTWWSATGKSGGRGGCRRPFVMAMNINGKDYSLVLTGYDWSYRSQMMTGDFSEYTGDALCYDMRKYSMAKIGAAGLNGITSFGSAGCWYWDADNNQGRIAIWNGREGLATFIVSSYE